MAYKNKSDRVYNNKYESRTKKQRARRNKVRQQAIAAGKAHVGDNTDVDHKKPISKGGSDKKSNLRVVSKSKNRSFARTSSGAVKGKTKKGKSRR